MAGKTEKKTNRGRKSKVHDWLTEDGLMQVESWARDGLSDTQIAKNMGIAKGTYYNYQNDYLELKNAIKRGKAPVDVEVENALLKSALGYEVEEVKTYIEETANGQKKRIEKTKKHIAPNVTAQIFWLKNRKSEMWGDKVNVQHNGAVTQNVNHFSSLNDDELRKLAEIESGDE